MSSPNDQAGRIHKQAFTISIAVLLGICLLCAASRFYVRLCVQKQLSIDDGFLVVAICCLICSVSIVFSVTIDKMYLVQALLFGVPGAEIPSDILQQSYEFHKWITITLMLSWCAIMAVKFSFLFLFRKLIERIRPLVIYWWVVTAYNIGVLGYGLAVYYVACPYYDDPRILQCSSAPGTARTIRFAVAQTVLDALGDFLILYIPVKLIYKVQIKWTQKAILASSLCLTVIMILVTIVRISGIKVHGSIDQVWESYFIILAAEIGIILTAATAFRAFFVSRRTTANDGVEQSPEHRTHGYSKNRYLLKRLLTPKLWRSKVKSLAMSGSQEADEDGHFPMGTLPHIPRAHMTGVRTFIDGRGKGTNASHIMGSQAVEGDEDTWPLHHKNERSRGQV